jgi:methionine synthase I (cobalamin-dependent)
VCSGRLDGSVKLKALCVVGGCGGTAPAHMKVLINRGFRAF